jgi:phytoene synthase
LPGEQKLPTSARSAERLRESFSWCERVARERARNFYPSFVLLNRAKHRAICSIYAFMRYCDDLADDDGVTNRSDKLAHWREDLEAALEGRPPNKRLWPAFLDTVRQYRIPHSYFRDIICGISSDLEPRRIRDFQELYVYCYQVAGAVGLVISHIYGFDDADAPRVRELSEKCGIAFQLTNILRDVREDTDKGRVYLPEEDLVRFGVKRFVYDESFRSLMAFEAKRARTYYDQAAPLANLVSQDSRPAVAAIVGVYSRLLERIVESGYDVLARRIALPKTELLRIAARARLSRGAASA